MNDTARAAPWSGSRVRWSAWGLALAVWTVVLVTPQPALVAREVLAPDATFPAFKLTHITGYALMALLTVGLPVSLAARWALVALLSAHAFGTEFVQMFVPGRTPSLADVGFDHVGLVAGCIAGWLWWRH